jgi:hypothetical protein
MAVSRCKSEYLETEIEKQGHWGDNESPTMFFCQLGEAEIYFVLRASNKGLDSPADLVVHNELSNAGLDRAAAGADEGRTGAPRSRSRHALKIAKPMHEAVFGMAGRDEHGPRERIGEQNSLSVGGLH